MSAHGSWPFDLRVQNAQRARRTRSNENKDFDAAAEGSRTFEREINEQDLLLAKGLAIKDHRVDTDNDQYPIASGAVYLAQMMAHDLVLSIPTGNRDAPFESRIDRPLMLDSLYGLGPANAPHLYAIEGPPEALGDPAAFRPMFRLTEATDAGDNPQLARFRDFEGRKRNGFAFKNEVLIADRRNDSHALIAQITAVWQSYHNHTFVKSSDWEGFDSEKDSESNKKLRFVAAQNHVREAWRNVIINDVFPILFGDVNLDRFSSKIDVSSPPPEALISLRALHSLPLGGYIFGAGISETREELWKVLKVGSHGSINDQDFTITENKFGPQWAVPWHHYFDGVSDSGSLAKLRTRFHLEHAIGLDTSGETNLPILAVDLTRGRQLLYTPNSVRDLLKKHQSQLHDSLKEDSIEATVTKHLTEVLNSDDGHLPDISAIAGDPPLNIVILLDAMLSNNGACLGGLGRTLIGPWLIGALREAENIAKISGIRPPENVKIPERFTDILKALKGETWEGV